MPLNFKLADINLQILLDPNLHIENFLSKYLHSISTTKKPNVTIFLKYSEEKKYNFKIISPNLGVITITKPKSKKDYETLRFLIKAFVDIFATKFNIMLLHASSVIIHSQAYIFVGSSGAGKSTIISLLPKKYYFSDDVTVVKQINNEYYLYHPIFEPTLPEFQNHAFPIKKIFLLEHAWQKYHAITKLSRSKILTKLTKASFQHNLMSYFPKYQGSVLYQQVISRIKTIDKKIPVFNLSFYKNKNILETII